MNRFNLIRQELVRQPKRWLVTGAAGFIGSNLVEWLLDANQTVVGLDNFATGHPRNLAEAVQRGDPERESRFEFIEGDICDPDACQRACEGIDYVLHHAALGSVPRSIENPAASHRTNVDGFVEMLVAARNAGVQRFVYASSSAVYGDHRALPKVEFAIGRPLSPYALTKRIDEEYASLWGRVYGLSCVGLRYFNVFGKRQDPAGAYAAVIPRWVAALLAGERCRIHGDGETSRDFCYVDNVIQANILAAVTEQPSASNQVYNVAYGGRTTLNQLFTALRNGLAERCSAIASATPEYTDFRSGDVRHSQADITKISSLLGYEPSHSISEGLALALDWYVGNLGGVAAPAQRSPAKPRFKPALSPLAGAASDGPKSESLPTIILADSRSTAPVQWLM
jgi:UDP-N-acetylglucosamine 4-epimerase